MSAVCPRHVECVQYLISNAGDVAAANESGLTPLHMAAQEGHGPTCELLIKACPLPLPLSLSLSLSL